MLRSGWRQTVIDLGLGLATVPLTGGRLSLPGRVAWWARRRSDHPAFTDVTGTLTWSDLDAEVDRLAATITTGSVSVSQHHSRDSLLLTLAAMRAGARVLLNNPRLGVTEGVAQPGRRQGRLVVYTSGTSGAPTAVAPRWNLLVGLQQLGLIGRLPLRHLRAVGVMVPLDRGHGLGTVAFCLATGSELVDLRSLDHLPEQVEAVTCLPSQLGQLVDLAGQRPPSQRLRTVVCGSEPLDDDLAGEVTSRLAVEVWNCYGSTQTGTVTVASPDDRRQLPGTVGRPLPFVTITADQGQLRVRSPQGRLDDDRGAIVQQQLLVEPR